MAPFQSGILWLRRHFAWSNSALAWQERLVGGAFLLVAAGLVYLSAAWFALWQSAAAWAIYGLALAIFTQQGLLQLFGPVLVYDMIRSARRSRYVFMRLLYAGLLLFILCFLYINLEAHQRLNSPQTAFYAVLGVFLFLVVELALAGLLLKAESRTSRYLLSSMIFFGLLLLMGTVLLFDQDGGQQITRRETALLGEYFFGIFMLVQLAVVVLLTPAYVAGAIAEEKDRKTLEFLLATDLNNREIVLSKFLSRLANMTMLLLTGLPILSMLQFIGGVDTPLMLAGFAATGLTMLGIASLSILLSTLFKKPRDAINLTYLFLIVFVCLGTVGMSLESAGNAFMRETLWWGDDAPTVKDLSDVVNAGNPVAAAVDVTLAINGFTRTRGRTNLAAELPGILERYAWFYLPFSLICILWSIARLRAVALKQTIGGSTAKLRWWHRYRPPVGELPMLWKELNVEGGMKFSWVAMIAASLLLLLTVGSGLRVLGEAAGNLIDRLPEQMNVWFRIAGTGVACLTLLSVSVRASTCISVERERDTLDALITTPLSAEALLAAKILGSLSSVRLAWAWVGVMFALAIYTRGLHVLAVPILVGAWFVYALFFAMVGAWFSMIAKTSLRATVFTVLTTIGLGAGHWLFTFMCCMPVYFLFRLDRGGDFPDYFAKFEAGMTPPFVFAWCSFCWIDLSREHWRHREFGELFSFCLLGIFLWGVGCVVFWYGLLVPKFKQITRREELTYQ